MKIKQVFMFYEIPCGTVIGFWRNDIKFYESISRSSFLRLDRLLKNPCLIGNHSETFGEFIVK